MSDQDRPATDDWLLATLQELLTAEQLAEAKATKQGTVWDLVAQRSWVDDERILDALAARFRMKVADLASVSPDAVVAVSEHLARRYQVVPVAITASTVDIATANPHDLDCERALEFAMGRTVRMLLASPRQIDARLDELYGGERLIERILDEEFSGLGDIEELPAEDQADIEVTAGQAGAQPIIRLVNRIVAKAIQVRSSDIHLEPEENGVAIRYRVDGMLTDESVLPKAVALPLVARVKIMARLDIADRLRPQDGRARVGLGGKHVDLRISTLPASFGEKVVIRILDSSGTVLALDSLGLNPDEIGRLHQLMQAREGLILVTGPTGSGKTTLLYSMIRQIQKRGVNVVTVEDPVEYRLQGIVQVQINEKAGLTFPAALRSILRQDPDVILVGEVRDRETGNIAIQAALTGHLVLTTLHTMDAASSITRLTDIGIESYKLAAAVKGIVAQRLLRRLCPACRQPDDTPPPPALARSVPAGAVLYRAVGCGACAGTGYRGRLGITEVLVVSAEVERRIGAGETAERIAEAGKRNGMRSLWESGMQHALRGDTSFDELIRVLEAPPDDSARPARPTPTSPARAPSITPPRAASVRRQSDTPSSREGSLHAVPSHASLGGAAFDLLDDKVDRATGQARSVLLVEDEAPLRQVLRDLLEREGFEVHEAPDGVDALTEIDRAAPDIIVLDLNLPRLDGYGVLSHLQSRPATKAIPVIVLTAKGDEDSEVRVFEYGATEYIAKPFRPRALIARLNALVKNEKQEKREK